MESDDQQLTANKSKPVVAQLKNDASLNATFQACNIPLNRSSLALIGGASRLSQEDYERVRALVSDVLAPLAEELDLAVVDGGTDAGVMQLIGQARHQQALAFPLIGFAPQGLVHLPEAPSAHPDASALELNHTHCFLIPGSDWGDESAWIVRAADQLAQTKPSVTVLVNGGEVTWKDAQCHVAAGRTVVVVAGSGRTADVLARAIRGEAVSEQRAKPLVDSGKIKLLGLNHSLADLKQAFRAMLKS